jgi:hypothetical protein
MGVHALWILLFSQTAYDAIILLSETVKKAFVGLREHFCDDRKGAEKNIRCKFHGENILWT